MDNKRGKYQIQHEERRGQILAESRRLFLERGLSCVKMVDIADACAISRQTLYKYFSSIDAVIFSLQSQLIRQFSLCGEHDLKSALERLFRYYQEDPEDFYFISMFDIYIHTHQVDKALLCQYRETIRQCIPEPHFPPDASSPSRAFIVTAVHAAWGLITRMMILGEDYTHEYSITEEESYHLLCRALCGEQPGTLNLKQTVSEKL